MVRVERGLFPHPVLVGDIGGTNARFALLPAPGAGLTRLPTQATHDHAGLEVALAASLAAVREAAPRSMLLCGAGPVLDGRRIVLTNAGWTLDGLEIARGLAQGLLLNDFEAQALALPALPADGFLDLTPDLAPRRGTRVVLGPGTGLGVGALADVDGRFLPLPSEGGHVGIGPANAEEEAYWPHIERIDGRVTAETLLSGPGLARLHRARLAVAGRRPVETDGPTITEAALAGHSPDCRETVAAFLHLLATFAGDMALAFGAAGGVHLSGGILPRLAPLIDAAAFRAAFAAKAPVAAFVRAIPLRLVTTPDAVLHGLAAIAERPDLYLLDWQARLWRP